MPRLATWNVNSIKARLASVLAWVEDVQPDILLLQELKCEAAGFPADRFEALGYQAAVVGQKSYNGVALLARAPIEDRLEQLPGDADDRQARYVEATIGDLRVASLYLPNGNPPETSKYPYKLAWMARLRRHAADLLTNGRPVVLGGDYNVIPEPIDVYDPDGWRGDALFRLETRAAYRTVLHLGFTEAYRALHAHRPGDVPAYTFWDYQGGRWPRDEGLRIDHFLLSPQAADLLQACTIDRRPRAWDKASDHTPVVLELASGV